jgi:hypothetical protein
MREAIAAVYPNNTWKRKVDAMPDYQVIAVYHSFKETGRFDKPVDKDGKPISKREMKKYTGIQLSFDI